MPTIDLRSDDADPTPIEACLNSWHEFLAGDSSALERLIAADAVLHSPVLFKTVEGKELVILYLTGASMSFVGTNPALSVAEADPTQGEGKWDGRFRYVRKLVGSHDAMLEFETTMAGKYVNGVDLIRCDDNGMVVDFKVMVRPRQAAEAVRELMAAALDTLRSDQS